MDRAFPKLAYAFSVPWDVDIGFSHDFPNPDALKQDEADEHYRLAAQLSVQEFPDFLQAKHHLLRCLEFQPNFCDALVLLGDIACNRSNPDLDLENAAIYYNRALQASADHPKALLGLLYSSLNDYRFDEAVALYARLVKDHARYMKYSNADRYESECTPAFGWFYSRRRFLQVTKAFADRFFEHQQWESAIGKLKTILEADERDIEARLGMAIVQQRCGHHEDAIQTYQEAINRKEECIDRSIAGYRMWMFADHVVRAEDRFAGTLIEGLISNLCACCWNNLGVSFVLNGKIQEAENAFQHVIDSHGLIVPSPRDAALTNIGVINIIRGNRDAAASALARASHVDAHYNMAVLSETIGDLDSAGRYWKSYLSVREIAFEKLVERDMCLYRRVGEDLVKGTPHKVVVRQRYVDSFDQRWRSTAEQHLRSNAARKGRALGER